MVNVKLEDARGALLHAADVPNGDGEPPDVVAWGGRVFRFARTDGLWDQKKHVYREASLLDLGGEEAAPVVEAVEEDTTRISATLSEAQAALLKRVRQRGSYANNKAALLAGLDALDHQVALSNEALISMIAKRLRGTGASR